MDNSSQKIAAAAADVQPTPAGGKPADVNQSSTEQPKTSAAVNQPSGTKSEPELQGSIEAQSKSLPAVAEQAAEPEKPTMDTEPTSAPATTAESALTTGDANQVDPVLAESASVKPEVLEEKALEVSKVKAEIPSLSTPLQDSDLQAGLSGDTRRSRSESTGGISVKSGGSSASALPDNVPRVGGVRCCESSSWSSLPGSAKYHLYRLGLFETTLSRPLRSEKQVRVGVHSP